MCYTDAVKEFSGGEACAENSVQGNAMLWI